MTVPARPASDNTAHDQRRRQTLHALGLPLLAPWVSPFVALSPLALSACADTPPAPRLLRWPTRPAAADLQAAATNTAGSPGPGAWQLMPWGALPDWMDSQSVLVAEGPAGLRALPGVRWAEPLRDALPRLLALDLSTLRAPHALWTGVVPSGVRVDRQLRVQVLALDSLPRLSGTAQQAGQVRLLAKWSLADPSSVQPPRLVDERIELPWDGSADGLALAQRAALWALACHIAGVQTAAR